MDKDAMRGVATGFPYKSPYSAQKIATPCVWKLLKTNWLLRQDSNLQPFG